MPYRAPTRVGQDPASMPGAVLDAVVEANRVPWWRPGKKRAAYRRAYVASVKWRMNSIFGDKEDDDL